MIFLFLELNDLELIEERDINIYQIDTLKEDWSKITHTPSFDYVIGNPPYVNNHELSEEYIEFLNTNAFLE